LINLTHEQLHLKYPQIEVTITTSLQFQKDGTTALSLSIRTYSEKIIVKDIIVLLNSTVGYEALGSECLNAAGGRIKFDNFNLELQKANFLL